MKKKLFKSLCLTLLVTAGLTGGPAFAQAPATPPAPQPRLDWPKSGYNVGFPAPADKRVTRDNALAYPYTGWSYQHVRELFPTRGVARGGPVSPLPSQPMALDGLTFAAPDGKKISWAQFEAETHTDAMLVLHKGKIVYERYANGMTPESQHLLFSVTKSFVGLMAELLVHDGKLDETAKVITYVPELAGSAWETATVRDLMDMRDGVSFDENYANPNAEIHRYALAWGWGPANIPAPKGVYEALPTLKTRFAESGGPFRYRSAATDALGWVIARASGQSLSSLVSERVWKRLGVEHDATWAIDPAGQEIAAAGLNVTARDLARLGEMLRQDGRFNGQQIIPAAVVKKIKAGSDNAAFRASNPIPARLNWSYRSQFWISHDANQSFNLFGVAGQRVYIDPTNQIVIVRFGSHPVLSNLFTAAIHDAAFGALTAKLTAR